MSSLSLSSGDIMLEERFEAKTPILVGVGDGSVDISPSLVPILTTPRIPSTEPLAPSLTSSTGSPHHSHKGGGGHGSGSGHGHDDGYGSTAHSSSHYTIPAHSVASKRRIKLRNGQHQLYEVSLTNLLN
jgi:hypothetical protein